MYFCRKTGKEEELEISFMNIYNMGGQFNNPILNVLLKFLKQYAKYL